MVFLAKSIDFLSYILDWPTFVVVILVSIPVILIGLLILGGLKTALGRDNKKETK